jgi:hypothetical protein
LYQISPTPGLLGGVLELVVLVPPPITDPATVNVPAIPTPPATINAPEVDETLVLVLDMVTTPAELSINDNWLAWVILYIYTQRTLLTFCMQISSINNIN